MSDRTDNVVRLRQAYDQARRDRYAYTDPIKVVGDAAGRWLEAENELTNAEFAEYMHDYRAAANEEKEQSA